MRAFTFLVAASLALAIKSSPSFSRHSVAFSTMELTNPAQAQNPFHPGEERRRLMVSAFYPAGDKDQCKPVTVPYMPTKTAAQYDAMYGPFGVPQGAFASIDMTLCKPPKDSSGEYPLVLFSPGMGDSRLIYNFMAASLASDGYVVVTIDHPYDALIIEYPDHSTVSAFNITTDNQILTDLTTRTEDVIFVIDQLQDKSVRQRLFHDTAGPQYLTDIQMFGHSFGGATAGQAMLEDSRISSGVNLDGTMFGSVVRHGLDRPFMFVSHEGKSLTTDSSWQNTWRRLKSTKVEITAENSQHGTFTDFPYIAQQLGIDYNLTSPIADLLGTIPGDKALGLLRAVVGGFFQYTMGQVDMPVSSKTLEAFPELHVLKKVLNGRCG